jgi:hypothetical protein
MFISRQGLRGSMPIAPDRKLDDGRNRFDSERNGIIVER